MLKNNRGFTLIEMSIGNYPLKYLQIKRRV
ncbi:prepilin-type N-terminal cleavage/methylation domain-containing protein [Virgibacillus salexigens]|nr:prepilin-type N-terminal cleavage/methylation domain-containing protein [Virgibacillus massiliensis]